MEPTDPNKQPEPDTDSNNQPHPAPAQQFESEPETIAQPAPNQPVPTAKSRKPLFIGGTIAVILVILFGGGALAYNFWYQNPNKVIGDSLFNAMKAKTITADGNIVINESKSGIDVTMAIQSAKDDSQGKVDATVTIKQKQLSVDIKGSALYSKSGDLYFKSIDTQKTVDQYYDGYIESLAGSGQTVTPAEKQQGRAVFDQQFGPIVKKVENKWIKVSTADLKDFNKSAGNVQQCLTDAVNKLRNDKSASREVSDTYKNNMFLNVDKKLGSKDGNLGYKVSFDESKSKKFSNDLEKTTIGKEIKKCTDAVDASTKNPTSPSDIVTNDKAFKYDSIELWVSRWTHELEKVRISGSQDTYNLDISATTHYNKPVTVEVPKDFITIQQLQADIKDTVQTLAPSSSLGTI